MKSDSQRSSNALDLTITRDWLLGVDRERRNASHRNGMPVRISTKPVKTARLSIAGLMVEMPSFMEAQEQFVRCYLRHVLKVAGGNVSWAARLARRNRTGFHRLLVKHKLAAADFRSSPDVQGSHAAATTIGHFDERATTASPFTRLGTNSSTTMSSMALR
jgi:hypothetical protein